MSCAFRIYFQRPLAWSEWREELITGRATFPVDLMRSLRLITDWPLPKSINISDVKSHDSEITSFRYILFMVTSITLSTIWKGIVPYIARFVSLPEAFRSHYSGDLHSVQSLYPVVNSGFARWGAVDDKTSSADDISLCSLWHYHPSESVRTKFKIPNKIQDYMCRKSAFCL